MSQRSDDVVTEAENGELVHWMEPRHVSLGLGGVSAATLTAFALGAVAAVGVMALMHRLSLDEPWR